MSSITATDAAFRHCRAITRSRARNFYYGLKLLPEPQRSALYAVYAWMRWADDIGDGALSPEASRMQIAALRQATVDALAGRPASEDPVLLGLRETAERFTLPAEPFHAMLDGQLDDLDGARYETFEELRGYLYRVASTVGLLCIEIWGYDDDRAPKLAIDRGVAFQLTNILRDVVEDREQGRVYLPAEDFQRARLSPEDLCAWSDDARCRDFLLKQIGRAADFYRASSPLDAMITPACRPALWAMTRIYRGLLDKMGNDPTRIVRGPRPSLSPLEKGTIAVRAHWAMRSASRDAVGKSRAATT